MAVVPRVLLDHVQVDPADIPGALAVVTVAGHDIIELLAGHGGARVLYLLPEGLDAGGRVRVIKRVEVLAGLVRVVREQQTPTQLSSDGPCRILAIAPAGSQRHQPSASTHQVRPASQ